MCLLFQQSLNSGELPSIWKCANKIPVFKGNGTRFKVENYRPISLTSSLCKVMEGIIFDSIYIHCTENNLLTDSQHGFRKNKSTSSNLLEFMDDISKSIDMKDSVDVITVDFSKAFDVISYDKLLHKLSHYGIRGSILSWIKSFLKGRLFYVKLNDCYSGSLDVTSSVPQGSKFGPLFYIIYANDIAKLFHFSKIKSMLMI